MRTDELTHSLLSSTASTQPFWMLLRSLLFSFKSKVNFDRWNSYLLSLKTAETSDPSAHQPPPYSHHDSVPPTGDSSSNTGSRTSSPSDQQQVTSFPTDDVHTLSNFDRNPADSLQQASSSSVYTNYEPGHHLDENNPETVKDSQQGVSGESNHTTYTLCD